MTDANHLVCAGDKGLHTLKLDDGKSASWKSHTLTGVKSSTLRTIGSLVEVEIVGGKLAKLNTDTGNMAHVEIAGNGVIMEAGCGQVMVTQNCETQVESKSLTLFMPLIGQLLLVCLHCPQLM